MSDKDLRSLERLNLTTPDTETRDRLERAWIRQGLGWQGEDLRHLIDTNRGAWLDPHVTDRGVYRWLRHDTPIETSPEFVYVPGGEIECEACDGTGWEASHGHDGPVRDACEVCFNFGSKSGFRKIEPFYVGRFPVTWAEYRAFSDRTSAERVPTFPWEELRPEHDRHPVVHVTQQDTLDFCEWSGLRLLTLGEWRWATYGPLVAHPPHDHFYDNEHDEDDFPRMLDKVRCVRCDDHGVGVHRRPCLRQRRYPWGDGQDFLDRCVWSEHPTYGGKHTAPVTERARDLIARGVKFDLRRHDSLGALDDFYPARPAGMSWCGAHDMVGNVWQRVWDESVVGGSFTTQPAGIRGRVSGMPVRSAGMFVIDVGFRVALSGRQS